MIDRTIFAVLVARAKLNKPSSQWKTSEWDRVVDAVAEAMKQPEPTQRLTPESHSHG